MPYFAPSSFLAIAVSRNSTKEVTWPCSTSTELRDFGGGLVLGFRMAHAGSPADGSLVAIDEQVENGEVAQREMAIMESNHAMILAWPVTGAVSAPQAGRACDS